MQSAVNYSLGVIIFAKRKREIALFRFFYVCFDDDLVSGSRIGGSNGNCFVCIARWNWVVGTTPF